MAEDPRDRADNRPPDPSAHEPQPPPFREVDAYAVLSYLLGGVVLYGGLGWLLDWWLGTRAFVGGGIALGAAAGVWVVWLRYGRS